MKNVALIFCLFSSLSYAQQVDSIPLRLLPKPPTASSIIPWTPPYHPDIRPWDPWPPYIFQDSLWSLITLTDCVFWVTPPCGDSYYENGQLSSRIECEDSVMHGKAIYWDETGHKTNEYTYAEGHMIKSKYYDSRGRLTGLCHYDYAGSYHGVCVDYTYEYQVDPEKTVTHYDHGTIHGSLEIYRNNMLVSKEIYDQGTITESFTYHENGKLATHEKYGWIQGENYISETSLYYESGPLMRHQKFYVNQPVETYEYAENGQLIFVEKTTNEGTVFMHQRWDKNGTFIGEQKYDNNRYPVSPFLVYYDAYYDKKQLDWYGTGWAKIKSETYVENRLVSETFYRSDNQQRHYIVEWFENGDTAAYYQYNQLTHIKKWNADRKVIEDYYFNNINQFAGGYYIDHDTMYCLATQNNPHESIPIARWIVYKGDTLRMDYIRNTNAFSGFGHYQVLASNYYAYHTGTQTYVPHGTWKFYDGNNLESVYTYNMGNYDGRAVFYSVRNDSSYVCAEGHFANNQKTGSWIFYTDSTTSYTTYQNDMLEGESYTYDKAGKRVKKAQYQGNQLNGETITYHADGITVKSTENYQNGQLHGLCGYYNAQGQPESQGEYENGVRIKTWFFYEYFPDGSVKRTKQNYRSVKAVS